MTATVADPLLRRLERRALGFCVFAAAAAWWVRGGQGDVALGVLGGAVLIGVSYWAIRSSIDGILALALPGGADGDGRPAGGSERPDRAGGLEKRPHAGPDEGLSEPRVSRPADPVASPRRGRALVYGFRFIGRYAVLGLLAYVMLVWLRLHPVGVIIGVSSIAVAAAWEAGSTLTRRG